MRKKCTNCGHELSDKAKFCNKCGTRVTEAVSLAKESTVTAFACPQCGEKLKPNAKFCSKCGKKIETTVAAPSADTNTDKAAMSNDTVSGQSPQIQSNAENKHTEYQFPITGMASQQTSSVQAQQKTKRFSRGVVTGIILAAIGIVTVLVIVMMIHKTPSSTTSLRKNNLGDNISHSEKKQTKSAQQDVSAQRPPSTASLTEEAYKATFEEIFSDFQNVNDLDMTDVNAAKKTLQDMKVGLNRFIDLNPPESCKAGHKKLASGCQAMIEYIDTALSTIGETDQNKINAASKKMAEAIHTAMIDMTEGAEMLDAVFNDEPPYDPNAMWEQETLDLLYDYVYGLNDAINAGDFSLVSSVFVPGSEIYNNQRKLVQSLSSRGITENVISLDMLDHTLVDDTHATVTSYEVIGVSYADGSYKQVTQSYTYYMQKQSATWKMYDMVERPENVPDESGSIQSNSDRFTQEELRMICQDLWVPDELDVIVKVDEPYYWDATEQWIVPISIFHNGTLVASADIDADTKETLRNIMMYQE